MAGTCFRERVRLGRWYGRRTCNFHVWGSVIHHPACHFYFLSVPSHKVEGVVSFTCEFLSFTCVSYHSPVGIIIYIYALPFTYEFSLYMLSLTLYLFNLPIPYVFYPFIVSLYLLPAGFTCLPLHQNYIRTL